MHHELHTVYGLELSAYLVFTTYLVTSDKERMQYLIASLPIRELFSIWGTMCLNIFEEGLLF